VGLNANLLYNRFREIEQSLERLEALRRLPRENFLADQDVLDVASYRLLIAIEAALQICFHVSAQQLQRAPESYSDCFALLEEAGIIPHQLAQNLQQMARFRNMLVHTYWEVDYGRVYEILQGRLEDLHQFIRAIERLL
jgi:uncharacterized protein YutE (UPF0331/DUF86 family)